jgi:phage terminase large subunit GpA-like protein
VSEWADKYRRLSSENSAEAGQWKTSRTPYLKDIMDAFSDDRVNRLVVVASSQVGKTEALLNLLGYIIDQDPGPVMYTMPTKEDAEDFSKRRLSVMIRDTPRVRSKVAEAKSRDANNTIYKKAFQGGMLTLTGTNAPRELASVPSRYVLGDELDRWAKSSGSEGDPWGLLEARTSTFYNSKMVAVSTPTVKEDSKIEKLFKLGTREYWSVQCPDCGEYSYITFNNIRYDSEVVEHGKDKTYLVHDIGWACPHCGVIHDENTVKHQPMKWIAESPEAIKNGCRSFWINGFYSPWLPWEHIIVRYLEAGKDPEKLQVVYNTLFGQLWENRGEIEDEDELAARAEDYGAELPDGVLCLTCGVDTQDNRLEYEVVGYGFFDENWGIEKGIIDGYPSDPETWIKLDGILEHAYSFKNGRKLRISLTFVDSGGHCTQDVYEQCAMRAGKVFAIKGSNKPDTPFTSPPKRVKYETPKHHVGTAWLYHIGVDAGKMRIMNGLKVKEPGPRMSHFPIDKDKGYDSNYYKGLLSETLVPDNRGVMRWVKIPGHERNEPLDCRNYANAAFRVLHPNLDYLKQKLENPDSVKKPVRRRIQKKRRAEEDIW